MREHPILFNGAMVRAILAGKKAQTRRAIKWKNIAAGLNLGFTGLRAQRYPKGWVLESDSRTSSGWRCQPTTCPIGQPGDRLWVRETWTNAWDEDKGHWSDPERYHYRADGVEVAHVDDMQRSPWIPSIHMPRRACRLVLEITDVRVERLQAISPADALAEGAMEWAGEQDTPIRDLDSGDERIAFSALWDSTGGDWNSNPWVWVITFKRIDA